MKLTTLIAIAIAAQGGGKGGVPTVTDTHFLVDDGSGQPVDSTRVPYRPRTSCYSWVIAVPAERRELAVREVFELPDSAPTWGSDSDLGVVEQDDGSVTAVNRDRSTGVTEFRDSLEDGLIVHGWCVAEGDPTGPHRIRVFVGDTLLHEFRFEVVAESY